MILRRLPSLPDWTTATRELDSVRREMERIFDSLGHVAGKSSAGVFPAINVSEDRESVYIRAELPGLDPQQLAVTVENNTLAIAGERMPTDVKEGVSYHRREREWGTFRRSFSLTTRVDAEKVEARYRDGILTVVLPKASDAKPRQIAVQSGVRA